MSRIPRFATTVVVSGALGLAGLGLGAGAAVAEPPPVVPGVAGGYTWCPGQALPFSGLGWDMGACHTYYFVPFGQGNVPLADLQGNPRESWIWADTAPPPPTNPPPPLPPRPPNCPPWNVIIGPSECGGL